jgi:hypothetical protein
LLFYLVAAAIAVLPFAEWVVRLPIALAGVASVALVFAVARRLFPHPWYAALAALLLALSPAHLLFSRQALDYILPLPFVLGWLWCMVAYLETRHAWLPPLGGLILGVGLYSDIASWALMPFFLAVTLLVVWMTAGTLRGPALGACAGVADDVRLRGAAWRHIPLPRMAVAVGVRGTVRKIRAQSDAPASGREGHQQHDSIAVPSRPDCQHGAAVVDVQGMYDFPPAVQQEIVQIHHRAARVEKAVMCGIAASQGRADDVTPVVNRARGAERSTQGPDLEDAAIPCDRGPGGRADHADVTDDGAMFVAAVGDAEALVQRDDFVGATSRSHGRPQEAIV